jgi:SpoVK/Ycf46/Vps4 family AAA+-type ATPase
MDQQTKQQAKAKPFKYKELKVYSSTEWLAHNKKRYQQVFDRYDTQYIFAELSFYNKNFDQEDWTAEIQLICYAKKAGKDKEVCKLDFDRRISKYDSIGYVREGWGNKRRGGFWKKGIYYWEAHINGEKVGTKYFYVEDGGKEFTEGFNPYIELNSVKLYEGSYDDVPIEDRTYYKTFAAKDTRYIYAEIELDNIHEDSLWHCELFVKFFNESRDLKGQIIRLKKVRRVDEKIHFTAGWGSNKTGSWRKGIYSLELVFMGRLIGVMPFSVGDKFEKGYNLVHTPEGDIPVSFEAQEDDPETLAEVMARLNRLIGLHQLKKEVRDHADYLQFLKLRARKGFNEERKMAIHSVFTGNPGTGKTTVARMMGKIYKKMGLLNKGHVHQVDRADLVGEYIGQTAPKVKEAFEKARGGVLFIDEAYSLARMNDDSKDFGREVIEMLVKEMSDPNLDFAVIVAGYPKEMEHFLKSNPGLRSRFKQTFEFPDYMPQELNDIALFVAEEMDVTLSEGAREQINKKILEAYRKRDKSFGNARFVTDLIEKAKMQLGLRIMQKEKPEALEKEELALIVENDIHRIADDANVPLPDIPEDAELLEMALEELDALIGLEQVKKEIRELVDLVKYYRMKGVPVLQKFNLHTLFIGNPGTGKNTVARILAKIYKGLGILERGHMVETDRHGMVAGYMGQSAIKTTERIDEAIGGVLFIDEAYALTTHHRATGDYGGEVIQTLIKRMEDQRGEFFVFAAGYPDNMETFLQSNPGLRSRFDRTLIFEDYKPEELLKIFNSMLEEQELELSHQGEEWLTAYLHKTYQQRDRYFGNARMIRKLVMHTTKHHGVRIARSGDIAEDKVTPDDLDAAVKTLKEGQYSPPGIGFKS